MRVAFGQHSLELMAWPSEGEMIQHLSSCREGYVILGEDARQYRAFISTEIRLGFTATSCFGIGLYSEGHGLVPHMLLLPESEQLVFGFNNEATRVSVREKRVVSRLLLDSLFRSFIHLKERKLILVFHEIGVTAISENGSHEWSYAKDIIQKCVLSETYLELEFLDEPSVKLALATGEQSSCQD